MNEELRLAQIRRRLAETTPGEWSHAEKIAPGVVFSLDDDMETTTSSIMCITDIPAEGGGHMCITIADPIISAPDAEFIAYARQDIEFLLALLGRES